MLKNVFFALIFLAFRPNLTTERQKLRPFVSKYPPRFPTLKTVFCSFYKPENRAYHPYKTLFLQSRNPISTNSLALLAVVKMSVAMRQKLIFEPAKINIISHTTKQLQKVFRKILKPPPKKNKHNKNNNRNEIDIHC